MKQISESITNIRLLAYQLEIIERRVNYDLAVSGKSDAWDDWRQTRDKLKGAVSDLPMSPEHKEATK